MRAVDITVVLLAGAAVAVASACLTGWMRTYALARGVLDQPGSRSSHTVPVPLGGGLVIAGSVLCGVGVLAFRDLISARLATAFVAGGVIVALIGWLDDRRHRSPGWRLGVQILAASLAVYALAWFPLLDFGWGTIAVGPVGAVLAVVTIVWLTNVFNFMDGSDGLAGAQAVCAGLGGTALALADGQIGLAGIGFLLAAASAGFLIWNWAPARVFMGDAGSYFLGYMFALLALAAERMGHIPALVFAILLAVFICDATWTLAMRVWHRARLDQGHREHAYQRLLDLGISHRRLAVSVALINVALLWPAALLADRKRGLLVPVVILIYFVLSVLWWRIQIVASRRTMRTVERR